MDDDGLPPGLYVKAVIPLLLRAEVDNGSGWYCYHADGTPVDEAMIEKRQNALTHIAEQLERRWAKALARGRALPPAPKRKRGR